LLSLLPSMALLLILGWSLAVLAGMLNVRFCDTRHLTDIGPQLLFYLTPIIYPPEQPARRPPGVLVGDNPLVPFLRLIRDTILENRVPSPGLFGSAALVAAVFAALAAAILWKEERQLIFHL